MRQSITILLVLLGRLRRRLIPLAVLALAACLLGGLAGRILAQTGGGAVRLVLVIAPERDGDRDAASLAKWLASLEGLEYCTIQTASQEEARAMLDRGEATAVLLLPEGFLASIQTGENRPPTLLTHPARAMEGWLAGWLGQSAAQILAAAQAGIDATLECYDTLPHPGLDREAVVLGVNLRYLRAALARTELVEVETVQATGPLAVADHYRLSTMICLLLLLPPLLYPLYGGDGLEPFLQRSRAAGVPVLLPTVLAMGLTWLLYWGLFWLGLGTLEDNALKTAGPAGLCALICAGVSGVYCTLCGTQAGAGRLCLVITGLCALVSGALIPPVLLPAPLQTLGQWNPLSWMRSALAVPLGYPPQSVWPLWAAGAALTGGCLLLAAWKRR